MPKHGPSKRQSGKRPRLQLFECASIATTNSDPSLTVKHYYTRQRTSLSHIDPRTRTETHHKPHIHRSKMPQAQPELKKVCTPHYPSIPPSKTTQITNRKKNTVPRQARRSATQRLAQSHGYAAWLRRLPQHRPRRSHREQAQQRESPLGNVCDPRQRRGHARGAGSHRHRQPQPRLGREDDFCCYLG
jgi:hypothetical protein